MGWSFATNAHAREWASATGKFKTEADFVRVDGTKVILKKASGELVSVDLDKLSDADRKHVETLNRGPIRSSKSSSTVTLKGVDPDDSSLLVRAFFGFRDPDSGVALSPDGRFLAVSSPDNGVQIADLVTGKRSGQYPKQEKLGTVTCLRFSPDGTKLVVGGKQGSVFAFSVSPVGGLTELGQVKCTERKAIQSIAIAPDNVTVLAGVDDSPLFLCRFDKPAIDAKLTRPTENTAGDIVACAFTSDGQTAYAISKDVIYTIDPKAKTVKAAAHKMAVDRFHKPSFSSDGSQLLIPTVDKIFLWDVQTAKTIRTFPSTGTSIDGVCFANGGANVVVVTHGKVEIYKASGQQIATDENSLIKTFNCAVSASDDGMYFATAGKGQQALVFRVPEAK